MKLNSIDELRLKSKEIRKKMINIYGKVGLGHITSGFSCMEVLVSLYYAGVMKYDSRKPEWEIRDHFILSKGHASTALYPILADVGYFAEEELDKCATENGILGICLNGYVPGVEISTGSLAIGFGIAAGIAMGKKLNRNNSLVFVMVGDAECYEGAIWETAMFAAHNKLNNLITIVDRNYLACTDFTENMVAFGDLRKKWESFGWESMEINGHNFSEIISAMEGLHSFPHNKPLVIIADTVKGKGVSFIENIPLMHGEAVKGDKIKLAINEIETGEDYE